MSVERFEKAKANYVKAKAEYDVLFKKVCEANAELNALMDAEKISVEEWADKTTETEIRMGLDKAWEKLRKAEEELIREGKLLLEKHLTEEQKAKIQAVWDCKFITIRQKLVDTLLRWKP